LREDRRHIQDDDVLRILREIDKPLNLEMAATDEMVAKAIEYKPRRATLVPERRRELTTEGGLDVLKKKRRLRRVVSMLENEGITTSLFIDPEEEQINASVEIGCKAIELHTGSYADATQDKARAIERERILIAARYANSKHLFVAAGHGLHLENIQNMASIKEIREFNIGHSLVARAIFVGLENAVREMKEAIADSVSYSI
jgi:pyridoxine 5-phosphate synthase